MHCDHIFKNRALETFVGTGLDVGASWKRPGGKWSSKFGGVRGKAVPNGPITNKLDPVKKVLDANGNWEMATTYIQHSPQIVDPIHYPWYIPYGYNNNATLVDGNLGIYKYSSGTCVDLIKKSSGVKKAKIHGKKIIWANKYTNHVTYNDQSDITIFTSGQYFTGQLGAGGMLYWNDAMDMTMDDWIQPGKP